MEDDPLGGPAQNPKETKLVLRRGVLSDKIGGPEGLLRSSFCITMVHLTRTANYRYTVCICNFARMYTRKTVSIYPSEKMQQERGGEEFSC